MSYINLVERFLVVHNVIVKYKLSESDEIYLSLMDYEVSVEGEYD